MHRERTMYFLWYYVFFMVLCIFYVVPHIINNCDNKMFSFKIYFIVRKNGYFVVK